MNSPSANTKLTKAEKRMRAVVAKFQRYVATYSDQEHYETYSDKTFLDDMLYGIGLALAQHTATD